MYTSLVFEFYFFEILYFLDYFFDQKFQTSLPNLFFLRKRDKELTLKKLHFRLAKDHFSAAGKSIQNTEKSWKVPRGSMKVVRLKREVENQGKKFLPMARKLIKNRKRNLSRGRGGSII